MQTGWGKKNFADVLYGRPLSAVNLGPFVGVDFKQLRMGEATSDFILVVAIRGRGTRGTGQENPQTTRKGASSPYKHI